ncbi:hypothetical protein MUK42_28432 [Musa troglodytarum]|nr:hypothetical protein MUK42_28432 [Musa troglodytarum]
MICSHTIWSLMHLMIIHHSSRDQALKTRPSEWSRKVRQLQVPDLSNSVFLANIPVYVGGLLGHGLPPPTKLKVSDV